MSGNDARSENVKGHLLVVDDTREHLRLLVDMLRDHGYKVRPAINGERALAVARATRPDLILLDVTMPGMDGFEVCQALKAEDATREIPVIFISALNEGLDRVKAFSVGAADYITKPIQLEEVLARVEHRVRLVQLHRRLAEKEAELVEESRKRRLVEEELRAVTTAAAAGPPGC